MTVPKRNKLKFYSAASRDSDSVLEEAEYGKHKNILFPAFIEVVKYSCGFGCMQTADLIGWNNQPGHAGLRSFWIRRDCI